MTLFRWYTPNQTKKFIEKTKRNLERLAQLSSPSSETPEGQRIYKIREAAQEHYQNITNLGFSEKGKLILIPANIIEIAEFAQKEVDHYTKENLERICREAMKYMERKIESEKEKLSKKND